MAETRPTATAAAKSSTSVQPKKKSNAISWLAPLICFVLGFIIWRFVLGNASNFTNPEIQLYSGTCGSLTSIACGTTSLSQSVTNGATYYVRVSHVGSSGLSRTRRGGGGNV